VTFYE